MFGESLVEGVMATKGHPCRSNLLQHYLQSLLHLQLHTHQSVDGGVVWCVVGSPVLASRVW